MTGGPSTDELRALRQWGLVGDVTVERTARGTMNDVFIVGRGSPEFVLRGHRHTDPGRVGLEHDVMDTARAAGVPASRTVATRDGSRFVEVAGRYWSLLEWLPGEHADRSAFTPLQARPMGEMLAIIHSTFASLPHVPAEPRSNKATATTVDRIDGLIRRIETMPVLQSKDHRAHSWLTDQRAWLANRIDEHVAPCDDAQVIHGDYHDANLLYRGDEIAGVIDWDKAGTRSASEEVVRCVHLSFGLDGATSTAFLDGYRSRRSLSNDQLDAAAARYGYERDRSIWLFDELYVQGNERVRPLVNERPFTPFNVSWSQLRANM